MRNGGMYVTKKKLNKVVLKNIKSHIKNQEQLKWQKLVIREEYINSK